MNRKHHFRGFLIAIEGIDGAGKTTQAHAIQDKLHERNHKAIRTKEPTTGHWGQVLRDSALTGRLTLEEEIEIFMKDRREHVENKINPALQEGKIVVVDRYYFSNMAYQGMGAISPEEIMLKNEAFAPEPDLLIVLDIDPKIGLERIRTRGDRANHFEKTETLIRAREIFNSIQKPYKVTFDARDHVDDIRKNILLSFNKFYTEKIAASSDSIEEQLDATLNLFGAGPIKSKKHPHTGNLFES